MSLAFAQTIEAGEEALGNESDNDSVQGIPNVPQTYRLVYKQVDSWKKNVLKNSEKKTKIQKLIN